MADTPHEPAGTVPPPATAGVQEPEATPEEGDAGGPQQGGARAEGQDGACPSAVPHGLPYAGLLTPESQLSKKKQKRLKRLGGYEGICQHWEQKKREYKERVKERKKVAREEKEAEWQSLTEEQRAARKEAAAAEWLKKREEKQALDKSIEEAIADPMSRPQVVIDCDFEKEMDDKAIKSMAQQLCLSYSTLRKAGLPCWLTLAGMNSTGKLLPQVSLKQNFSNWTLTLSHDPIDKVVESHPSASVTYLSGDSSNMLEELRPGAFYFVGGIVDRNQHKGITLKKAEALGMQHAKFPLDSFIQRHPEHINICKTLTTNHVVEILGHFALNKDWDAAFISILPKRRIGNAGPGTPPRREGGGAAPEADASPGGSGELDCPVAPPAGADGGAPPVIPQEAEES